jgi:hypothetical protein
VETIQLLQNPANGAAKIYFFFTNLTIGGYLIDDYSIGDYFTNNYSIGGIWWLLYYKKLLNILDYIIIGYW